MPYRTILIDIPLIILHPAPVNVDVGNPLILIETGTQVIDKDARRYYAADSPLLLLIVTRNNLVLQDVPQRVYVEALIGWDDGTSPYILPAHAGKRHTKITIFQMSTHPIFPSERERDLLDPFPDTGLPLSAVIARAPRLGRRGGNRPGSGRPRLGDERMGSYDVTLPQHMAAWLRSLGNDNISAGVREAAHRAGYTPGKTEP